MEHVKPASSSRRALGQKLFGSPLISVRRISLRIIINTLKLNTVYRARIARQIKSQSEIDQSEECIYLRFSSELSQKGSCKLLKLAYIYDVEFDTYTIELTRILVMKNISCANFRVRNTLNKIDSSWVSWLTIWSYFVKSSQTEPWMTHENGVPQTGVLKYAEYHFVK